MGAAERSCMVMAVLEFTPSAHIALSVGKNEMKVYPVPGPKQKIPSIPAQTRLWWFVQGVFHYGLKDTWMENVCWSQGQECQGLTSFIPTCNNLEWTTSPFSCCSFPPVSLGARFGWRFPKFFPVCFNHLSQNPSRGSLIPAGWLKTFSSGCQGILTSSFQLLGILLGLLRMLQAGGWDIDPIGAWEMLVVNLSVVLEAKPTFWPIC